MEYQDLNLKRQVFSKDSIKGKLVVDSTTGFYLAGTASNNALRGINYTMYSGNQYAFWVNNGRTCRRAQIVTPYLIQTSSSFNGTVNSSVLSQTIGSDTHLPNKILPALSIGKVYFQSSISNTIMEFDYDFATHTFTFVGLINSIDLSSLSGWSYTNNGSVFVVYRNSTSGNNVTYYPLSTNYDLSTSGTGTSFTSSIKPANEPFFYNGGRNFYVYSFVLGDGQFDLVSGSIPSGQEYRLESATERYRCEFNRNSILVTSHRPIYGQPFLVSNDRRYISFPCIISNLKTMNYGEFTVNGKFNDGFELVS